MRYIEKIYIACLILMLVSLTARWVGLRSFTFTVMGWLIPMGVSYLCLIVYGMLWSGRAERNIRRWLRTTIIFTACINILSAAAVFLGLVLNARDAIGITFLIVLMSLFLYIVLLITAVRMDLAYERAGKQGNHYA
ncbi:hypothetical protein EG831_00955 [bacterium]|nr:hypothetical protein [bacterium]